MAADTRRGACLALFLLLASLLVWRGLHGGRQPYQKGSSELLPESLPPQGGGTSPPPPLRAGYVSPPPPSLPPAFDPADARPRVAAPAVCIVGQLRTFSMPAVHLSLLDAVHSWGADVYFAISGGFNARRMERARKPATSCAENASAIALFKPVRVRRFRTPRRCLHAGAAYKQTAATLTCFLDAERHALRKGFAYEHFVRLRPDLLFLQTPTLPVAARGDDRVHVLRSHRDFAFFMNRRGLRAFRDKTPKEFRLEGCARGGSMEFSHPALKSHAVPWPTVSGLVRGTRHVVMRDAGMHPSPHLNFTGGDDARWRCRVLAAVTHVPPAPKRAPAKGKGRRKRTPQRTAKPAR